MLMMSWFLESRFWSVVRRYFMYIFYWEFWSMYVFHFPTALYYLWLSLRSRSFFFFSAANPNMWLGGMKGESKREIYLTLPQEDIPFTHFFTSQVGVDEVKEVMKQEGLSYPIVLKPDVGERGKRVSKIDKDTQLINYLASNREDFILQSYVDYPIELGVFYYRLPTDTVGKVSALAIKKPLFVKGDGSSTVAQLMLRNHRTNCFIQYVEETNPHLLDKTPKHNESVLVTSKGNHCQGAICLNGNKYITPELSAFIDQLSKRISGFYYGRFDIRCQSIAGLARGEHFKIIELNGAGGEPSTIYDPRTRLWKAYRDVFHHLSVLYKIACINHKRGIPYTSFSEVMSKRKGSLG